MYQFINYEKKVHRIVPSKFPPVLLFDWANDKAELEQIAALEGLTNDRLIKEYGHLNQIADEDWKTGEGATSLMAAFTHIGYPSRFCDASFGIYYAGDSQKTAIKETVFHREKFYQASNEPACKVTMREYLAKVLKPLIAISSEDQSGLLDPSSYQQSQEFGKKIKSEKHWGLYYPSVRAENSFCVAIFRPPALTIPLQGAHFEYIWDGFCISRVNKLVSVLPDKN